MARKAVLEKQFSIFTMASLATPTAKLIANPKKAKNSNFKLFYKHKGKESYLVSFIYKYCSVDIQYILDISRNKFKLENIMKLNTSVKHIKKEVKCLKIDISRLEIKAKEEN